MKADFTAHPAGEAETGDLQVDFDRRLRLEFHWSRITSDAGLLAFRELDDAMGLTGMAADVLADSRTGRNSRHSTPGFSEKWPRTTRLRAHVMPKWRSRRPDPCPNRRLRGRRLPDRLPEKGV